MERQFASHGALWMTVPLALAALTLLACCPPWPAGQGRLFDLPAAGEVRITDTDQGKAVAVRTGQTLVLDLEAAPTTGYRWEIQAVDPAILAQQGEPEFESTAPLLLGSPARQRFRLAVVGPGTCRLTVVYRRSWETGKEPAKVFGVNVTSQGAPVTPVPRP